MKAKEQGSCRFLWPAIAMTLLVVVMATAVPGTPTLAGLPDPPISQPEPFYIRLERPLAGAGVAGEAVPTSQVRIAADPGAWYNLMAEEFDGDTFPPANWSVDTGNGAGWGKQTAQHVSGSYSAGVVTTTTGTLKTCLFYGGDAGFAVQNVANAELNFNFWLDTEKDAVYFGWAASADGQNFYGARVSGAGRTWLTGVLDMQQYIGDDSVWIAFFVIGEATTGEQNVYLDNVVVRGLEPYYVYLPASLRNYEPPASTFTFTDDFSDVNSGWPHIVNWGSSDTQKKNVYGYTDKLVADYPNDYEVIGGACRQAGTYFMRVGHTDYGVLVVAKAPVQTGDQFTLEADIAFCDEAYNASTGIVFGLNDTGTELYRVMLIYQRDQPWVGDIKYSIWRVPAAGAIVKLVESAPSDHLRWEGESGYNVNHVKVVRDGCKIEVYFNGSLEWSTTSECAYTDQRWVGLIHDKWPEIGRTGAVVDNFVVEGAIHRAQPDHSYRSAS